VDELEFVQPKPTKIMHTNEAIVSAYGVNMHAMRPALPILCIGDVEIVECRWMVDNFFFVRFLFLRPLFEILCAETSMKEI
jgi:hypothetical protein